MSDDQEFEHRPDTYIITLKDLDKEFFKPESLRLQISVEVRKKPLDIGSWVYLFRGKNESIHDDRGTPVVISSLIPNRRELVVRVLQSWIGLRDKTVLTNFVTMEYFIDWLNVNGYESLFISIAEAQRAYRDYTAFLHHKIANQNLRPNSARSNQSAAMKIIELTYTEQSHHILSGAVRIVGERGSELASDAHFELYRDVFLAIAEQCSQFVLNKRFYPLVVAIRDYEVVLFPSKQGTIGPFKTPLPVYNPGERRIATEEEYLVGCEKLGRKRPYNYVVTNTLNDAQSNLDVSNADERFWHRLYLAGLASKAYACLFLMITGATPAEFAQFTYADALNVEKSPLKKELAAVKFRAGGRSTLYNIGRDTGLRLLKQYIELRNWILNGVSHERLFFSMPASGRDRHGDLAFSDLSVTYSLADFHNSIRGTFVDPMVPSLSPRKMRKHKSNGMHAARISPSTVAESLNHTPGMNLSTYAEATTGQLGAELGQFWQAIRHAAHVVRARAPTASKVEIATATGHCNGFNEPALVSELGAAAIEPNCRTQYGCLYCEHYVCHGDEEDLHKLLSLQYVINAVRSVAPDFEHAEMLYKELSIRIEFILDALGKRSDVVKNTVDAVRLKVFEYGELTAFWEVRLNRYEKLGVAF